MLSSTQAITSPGDPSADVGPNHHLAAMAGRIRSFDKFGVPGAVNATTDDFFASVRAGASTRDAQVAFDRLSQRWFVVMRTDSLPTRVVLAVSNSPSLDLSTVWSYYSFVQDTVAPAGNFGHELRNLSMAVDRHAIVIGGDFFASGSYVDSGFFVIRKQLLVQSFTLGVTAFRSLADAKHPVGVRSDDASESTTRVLALSQTSPGQAWAISVSQPESSSPFLGSSTTVTTEQGPTPAVPALGSPGGVVAVPTQILSGVESRFNATANERRVVFAYHSGVDNGGLPSNFPTRTGIRYYEYAVFGSSWILRRGGMYVDPAFGGRSYFQPGFTSNGQGHLVLGFNTAQTNERIGLAYAAIFATNPFGAFALFPVFTATSGYAPSATGPQPWGTRSILRTDPANDQTVWAYLHSAEDSNRWSLRAVDLFSPAPPDITGASPSSLGVGTHSVQIAGSNAVPERMFFQNDPSFPQRATAGVTNGFAVDERPASNLTVLDARTATIQVTIDLGNTPGTYSAFWRNPDGQLVQGGSFTVSVPSPSISSTNPSLLSARSGQITVRFTGTNFYSGSVVQRRADDGSWEDRPTIPVSSTAVDATLFGSDVFYAQARQYRVRNGANVSAPFVIPMTFFQTETPVRSIRVLEGRPLQLNLANLSDAYDGKSMQVQVDRLTGSVLLEIDFGFADVDPPQFHWFFTTVRLNPNGIAPAVSGQLYDFSARKWRETSTQSFGATGTGFFALRTGRLVLNEPGRYVGLVGGQPTVRVRVRYMWPDGRAKGTRQTLAIDGAVLSSQY